MPDTPPPPAAPDPQIAERRQQLMDRLTTARQQGLSWDTIHESLNNRVQAARKAGVSEAAIQQSLGFNNPEELIAATQSEAQQHLGATKPTSWTDGFINGLTHSSAAALLGVKPDKTPIEGHGASIMASLGETIGDFPLAVGGAMMGAPAGAAIGAGAGAVAGGGPEDLPAEAAGGGLGAALGGGAGAMALPQLIKSERDRYNQALGLGQVNTPEDYLHIQAQVMKDTGEAALVGAATGGAGRVAGPLLDKIGADKLTKFVGVAGAEATTMVTAQAALAGRMPRMEDYVDAAVTIGAFHTAGHITAPQVRAIRTRLIQHNTETGEAPEEAAERAVNDPVFRAQMLGEPNPKVPPGSSRTAVTPPPKPRAGRMAMEDRGPSDTYIIPRVVGDFDHALPWIMREEGGLTTDTGGVTKYGISANAHPGLDIAHISKDQAAEIYHREYWRAIDADALPPNMRLAAFDSAVNQGVGQTKTWLREAGGDLQAFMRLRIEKYAQLARDPKYAKYAASWARRLKDLGATDAAAGVIHRGPDNVGREFTPEDREALDLDGGGGGEKPPKPPEGGGQPEDEDPWEHVMGRVASDEGTDWLGNTVEGARRVYGELFDPMHPVRKLVDSVTKGEPLDDYRNPELLFRLAENSSQVAQWAIEKEMVDLDGRVTGPGLRSIVTGESAGAKFDNATIKRFLNGYAMSKWAVMMDAQGKKSGVDIDKAKAVIAEGSGQFEKSFQHLVDYRNSTLRWLVHGDVHDKAKADKLIEDNQSTIPGYRRMDDGSYQPTSSGKPGIWNPIKTAKGSERKVEPILKSLMQETFLRHEIPWNNRAMVALADLGIKGNEAVERRAVDINIISAMDDLRQQGIDDDMMSSLARSAGRTLPKDELPIFRNGKLYGVKFDDKQLTQVLRGYDSTAIRTTMKVLSAVTSIPRNMQTRFNPLFPVRLLTYDLPWQYIINPDSKGPLSGFFAGLGHMTSDPEGYQAWLRSGAADHIFGNLSKDQFIKRALQGYEDQSLASNMWNAAKTPLEGLTAWARMVSTPLRLGRYTKGLAQGETPLRAAVASTEAAFHRPGYGGPVGKAWNLLAPYTTAHLNGMEKSAKALIGIGRTVTGVDYNAKQTWTRAVATITVPVMMQWFAYKEEEWYKAMPDWQKNNAWFIIPPIGSLPAIPVAAPPILSAIFVAIPRMLLEGFVADNPHAGDSWRETFGASLMPPGMLTGASILTPVIEHLANYSFHEGRPLVSPDTVKGVQPAEQFTPYTSSAAKDLAQFASDLPLVHSNFGWSPQIIDNYISQWGGPPGRAAAAAAAAALGGTPANPQLETRVSDWPGISSWTVRYPNANAAPIQQFYDTITKLDQEHGSLLKEIREGNFDAFKRIVDQGGPSAAAYHSLNLGDNVPPNVDLSPYLDYLAQASTGADYENLGLVQQAVSAIKNARDYSHSVYEDHGKTSHDKRQILDMVNAQMQVMSERGNEAMDRALLGVKRAGAAARKPVPDSIFFDPPE